MKLNSLIKAYSLLTDHFLTPKNFTGIICLANRTVVHFKNEKQHRRDGPAVEYKNGIKQWWVEGELHRLDGPAIEHYNGKKRWYKNGLLHRINGPACVYANGREEWYINGINYTKKLIIR